MILEDLKENENEMKLSIKEFKDLVYLRFTLEDYDILYDKDKKIIDETVNKRLEEFARITFESEQIT